MSLVPQQPSSSSDNSDQACFETVIIQFERLWLHGQRPAIEVFLSLAAGERQSALVELVHAELELRLKAGEPARVEDYLNRFPELAGEPALTWDLIVAEYTHRARLELQLAVEEFQRRFPQLEIEFAGWWPTSQTARASPNRRSPAAGQEQRCGVGGHRVLPGYEALGKQDRGEMGVVYTETIQELCRCLAPPEEPDELGRLGPYRVLRVLGSGGMGVVFLTEDLKLRRPVALKVIRPALAVSEVARQRFLREAQAAAGLVNDHAVAIYQVGEDRGVSFLAMQLLQGETLDSLLKREGKLPTAGVLRIGWEVAEGLAASHSRGLIHRDIKPANLWVEPGPDGRIKIIDFGLSRMVAEDARLTGSGVFLGSPAYMAPEQARGDPCDCRVDLFSLGVVLYQMCVGRLPFRCDSTLAALNSLATDTPTLPRQINPAVPAALDKLVMQLLAKDPANRTASAQAVADRLKAIEREPMASPAGMLLPAALRPSRRRLFLAMAAAVLVLLPLGYFGGGTVLHIVTNKGLLLIEPNDLNLKVTVKRANVTVYDRVEDLRFVLAAGDYEVEMREEGYGGAHFATKKFTITRGRTERFDATVEFARNKAAERKAAEWVLSIGGRIEIYVPEVGVREFTAINDLPDGDWQVFHINLADNQRFTNAELERLKGLPHLRKLNLTHTKVGDDGLRILDSLPELAELYLGTTRVSNAGLRHFKGLSKLMKLVLHDVVLITDPGMEQLKDLKNLQHLNLCSTPVTDSGPEFLKGLTNLRELSLFHAEVSDAGLEHLESLQKLVLLDLRGSKAKVTAAGVAALRKALPNCNILTEVAKQPGQ